MSGKTGLAVALASGLWAGHLAWLRQDGRPAEAELRRAIADPEREVEHWRRALDWRPRAWEAMLGLAAEAEGRGQLGEARKWYDEAYRVNRTFRPAWARLNHLARAGGANTDFKQAAREAFQMSHRDRQALLELCWRWRPDGALLVTELAGRRPPVLLDLVRFLMSRDRPAARRAYALLLAQPYLPLAETNAGSVATAEERRGLGLDLCDLDLDLDAREQAWETWRHMKRHGLLQRVGGRGFDWRPERPGAKGGAPGVDVTPAGPRWVLAFSGEQAPEAVALWRPVPPGDSGLQPLPPGLVMRRQGDRLLLTARRGFRGVVTLDGEGIAQR